MTRIGIAFISDRGDEHLPACVESLNQQVGDWPFCDGTVIDDRDHNLGMAGAVRAAWQWAIRIKADYLFHVEEDFRFVAPPSIDDLFWILEHSPHLAQVVLKRQPWNEAEKAAGGIIEADPAGYIQCAGMRHSLAWCEHTKIFSLNPCLIPRRVLELGWPDGNEAEFTAKCLAEGYRFAFYGHAADPPRVEHVGNTRAAGWRL